MTRSGWSATDLPDLSGRTYVVTGATSGIGRVAARDLAKAGGRVVLAVRDVTRGAEVARGMAGQTEVRHLDLTDLASVRAFAEEWSGDLDVLVNNAGVMAVPLGRTKDAFELQMGTNHLGHFALTCLLLDRVSDKVVTVSSSLHRGGTVNLDDLNWERRRYDPWAAYGQSKLANLLFTLELQHRLQRARSAVRAVAAHPGYAATNLQSKTGKRAQDAFMAAGNRVLAQSEDQGALSTLYAATQDLPGDSFVGPDGRNEYRGHPTLAPRSEASLDRTVAARLWELSERLTGASYA